MGKSVMQKSPAQSAASVHGPPTGAVPVPMQSAPQFPVEGGSHSSGKSTTPSPHTGRGTQTPPPKGAQKYPVRQSGAASSQASKQTPKVAPGSPTSRQKPSPPKAAQEVSGMLTSQSTWVQYPMGKPSNAEAQVFPRQSSGP